MPSNVDPMSNWLGKVRFHQAHTGYHICNATTIIVKWIVIFCGLQQVSTDKIVQCEWTSSNCIFEIILDLCGMQYWDVGIGHHYPQCHDLTPLPIGNPSRIKSSQENPAYLLETRSFLTMRRALKIDWRCTHYTTKVSNFMICFCFETCYTCLFLHRT
jgi:hypothetical protein